MLSPYRVVDLTDEGAMICGQIMGDLGADVILVEPAAGAQARRMGPYLDDLPDVNRSLNFWSLNRNKRSITLDLNTAYGRENLLRLVKTSDFLIESFAPGHLNSLGLGYQSLAESNPALIMISITPFGQHGPKANWAATDLTVTAASGVLFMTGDEDRPPVHVSIPQAYLNAGAEAAVGALIALRARERDGLGQHVDVSAQTAMMMTTAFMLLAPGWNDSPTERVGGGMKQGPFRLRFVFPCKDGHVNITFLFGPVFGPSTRRLFEWIYEDGFCDEATRDKDWSAFGLHLFSGKEPIEEFARCTECLERFTLSHTKAELTEGAARRKILLVPVSKVEDLLQSEQLKAREFWTKVAHPELGREVTYPGSFAKLSQTPIQYRRRPPLLGEHTQEILGEPRPPVRFAPTLDSTFAPALQGLKVLDFTWVYAGPASTRYLADYGATVIRIESEKKIDPVRTVGPYKDGHAGIERSAIYCNLNLGKYGISLNLAVPEARKAAIRLVKWADVVIENFSPKAMRAWDMDYESLRKIKPDLIMLSTCLNGQTGPDRMLAGYGNMGACMAGFGELTGWPDRPPAAPFSAYTDFTSPKFITAALLAALDHKRRTGQGQYIDVSQVEAPIHLLTRAILDYTVNGRIQTRMGNALRDYAPTGVYPCAGTDHWVALAAPADTAWQALCATSGRGWNKDPRFTTAIARLEHRVALDEAIGSWTAGFEPAALEELLQRAGVPAHRVSTSFDALADPQLEARRHIISLEHPQLGRIPVETSRMRFSRTPAITPWAAPEIGQHNDYVLRELLGLTDEEITKLAANEVPE
ncbi:MAG: CoA transferase [Deltaproteobacteria bacterium]|nr:CoA transferase [Deltaproteobacteria bacterium]